MESDIRTILEQAKQFYRNTAFKFRKKTAPLPNPKSYILMSKFYLSDKLFSCSNNKTDFKQKRIQPKSQPYNLLQKSFNVWMS